MRVPISARYQRKIVIRLAVFKKTFLLSSYSNLQMVHAESRVSIVGNVNETGKGEILMPFIRLSDRAQSILEIILRAAEYQEHISDNVRS